MQEIKKLTAAQAVARFRELGLEAEAKTIERRNRKADLSTVGWPWNGPAPWAHTSYAYGFIEEHPTAERLRLFDARAIKADERLKNKRVTISLDFFRILDFPGSGRHRVLFRFRARHKFSGHDQDVNFNQTFVVQEGQRAAIAGYPIFVGLNLGNELVQFDVRMINVSNENDEKLLARLNDSLFQNGLQLFNLLNPLIPIVSEYAVGLTEMIAGRNRNKEIIAPSMGLYFGTTPTRPKLAAGAYIAVQTSRPDLFDWNKWVYNRSTGSIQSYDALQTELPFNYFVFSISETA
jgi:hypothetical protein